MSPRELPAQTDLFKAWQGITDRVQILALTQPIALALIINEIKIMLDCAINDHAQGMIRYQATIQHIGE
jgi:hypothetical protein